MKITVLKWSFAGLLASLPLAVQADVYRCVDAHGQTLYSDSPCPRDATKKSNITTDIGACTTQKCEAKHRQAAAEASERLRNEKAEAAAWAERRRQVNLDVEKERARLENLRLRETLDARIAAQATEAAEAAAYPVYPAYPFYPSAPPCGRHCGRPRHHHHDVGVKPRAKEPGVRARLEE